MLLFSTVLDINDGFTKEAFIQMAIDWNQKSPHPENIIHNMMWNGESSIRFGDDNLWLEILEYRNENTVAIRYEKNVSDGAVWGTDFVMNFNEMKMSVRLDRSYIADALTVDPNFTAPHFIRLLIDGGWLRDDGDLPATSNPEYVYGDNLHIFRNIVGGSHYCLPVVYVMKSPEGAYPLDVIRLAGRLKGVAHVIAVSDHLLFDTCRQLSEEQGKTLGDVNIIFPNPAFQSKHFFYREIGDTLLEKTVRAVINYGMDQQVDLLYTWQGVNNALLRDRLAIRSAELSKARQDKLDADDLVSSVDDEIAGLKSTIEKLTRDNERLTVENNGLRSKLNDASSVPALLFGNEDEFFPGEIKDILLSVLFDAKEKMKPSRRFDVLSDIIKSNNYQHLQSDRAGELKIKLKGYTNMNSSLRRYLEEFGFIITGDGKHYRLTYYGDNRYHTTLSKTSSDHREGANAAATIISDML